MNFLFENLPDRSAGLLKRLMSEKYMNKFTLVGGTALALQLGHRQSEDLDFIFDGEKLSTQNIKRFIAKTFPDYRIIRDESGYQLDFIINTIKITFFSTGALILPFLVREKSLKFEDIYVAPVLLIAVLKMTAISERCTMRDYYDLYFISRYIIPLSEIYRETKRLNPNLSPITYSETILFTRDIPENSISSHLNPKEQITKDEISDLFASELRKMNQ
jgi:predicted nucleotidyltransferase component of viral defense system